MLLSIALQQSKALAAEGPVVRLDLAPDQSKYDPRDENLRDAAYLLQKALNAEKVEVSCNRLYGAVQGMIYDNVLTKASLAGGGGSVDAAYREVPVL